MNLFPRWPDLVFHVLAHVPARCAASVHDTSYAAFSEQHLGAPSRRHLGLDCQVLAPLVADHATLAAVQLLAWLFPSLDAALAVARLELGQLQPGQVAFPSLLPLLGRHPAASELLWASALLELEWFERLPAVQVDLDGWHRQLAGAHAVAPRLSGWRVSMVRSLRLRGRVFGRDILVGAPCTETGISVEHAVWQACHEASVQEVGEAARRANGPLSHAHLEHAAVVLLFERARAARQSEPHARWLSHFGSRAPSCDRASLAPDPRTVLARILP